MKMVSGINADIFHAKGIGEIAPFRHNVCSSEKPKFKLPITEA
jgi:hypothetical protein